MCKLAKEAEGCIYITKYDVDKATFEDKYDKISVLTEMMKFHISESDCPATVNILKKKLPKDKMIISDY